MKLHDLSVQRQTEHVTKVFETRLGQTISFEMMTKHSATKMLSKVRSVLEEHRSSIKRHSSEKDPGYLKLMMLEQALVGKLKEMDQQVVAVDLKDPKTQATMKKAQSGQSLNPDEAKTMAAIASMQKESKKRKAIVKESELQQAQVVMAAQDFVDRMQKMTEEISEMQFKDLPALTDTIKNDMGVDQATQFQTDASAALSQLLSSVQQAKTQLESAQGVLTGQAPVVPGEEPTAAPSADDMSAELDIDANLPAEPAEPIEPEGSDEDLGRERR